MAVTQASMTGEQRKSVALEYLKRLDRAEAFFDLFADDAQVSFPKWGLATGRKEFEQLFTDLMTILKSIAHDKAYFNYIIQDDVVVVEGTSSGTTADGVEWRAGVTHAGRWCDVFEIRDFKIQRKLTCLKRHYMTEAPSRSRFTAQDRPCCCQSIHNR